MLNYYKVKEIDSSGRIYTTEFESFGGALDEYKKICAHSCLENYTTLLIKVKDEREYVINQAIFKESEED